MEEKFFFFFFFNGDNSRVIRVEWKIFEYRMLDIVEGDLNTGTSS